VRDKEILHSRQVQRYALWLCLSPEEKPWAEVLLNTTATEIILD
jgi:hypothetical protein